MKLLTLFADFSPRLLQGDWDIEMKCPYRENHINYGHGDGSSSFRVNSEKGVYKCMSCGMSGKVSTLLTRKFGVPVFEALEYSSKLKDLPEKLTEPYEFTPVETKKASLYELSEILNFDPPKSFLKRGLTVETLRHFEVGSRYNRDIETITIPLYSKNKELLGVKYREERKFWFSKNFERNDYLYNDSASFNSVFVVEGETDTFTTYQNSVINCVATLGASLSFGQLLKLASKKEVNLMFDNDKAGEIATELCWLFLREYGTSVYVVPYEAKDPGELTKEKLLEAINNKTDMVEYRDVMLRERKNAYLISVEEAKKQFANIVKRKYL